MRGKLIVFEGVEGCGKTTQIAHLKTWLLASGYLDQLKQSGFVSDLIVTREPGGTPLAQQIRHLLLTPTETESWSDRAELLLYAADRAQHVAHQLQPQLAAGALILCDRFTDSTIAYQGYGRGLDLALINQLNAIATDRLTCDLTFWLDLDVSVGLARAAERNGKAVDRIEQAGLAFHQRVQRGFTELAQASDRTVRIDASRSPDEVSEQIQTIFTQQMQQWYPQLSLR